MKAAGDGRAMKRAVLLKDETKAGPNSVQTSDCERDTLIPRSDQERVLLRKWSGVPGCLEDIS